LDVRENITIDVSVDKNNWSNLGNPPLLDYEDTKNEETNYNSGMPATPRHCILILQMAPSYLKLATALSTTDLIPQCISNFSPQFGLGRGICASVYF